MEIIHFLIVSPERDSFIDLADQLIKENSIEVHWVGSGQEALDLASHDPIDLVITNEELGDMTGLAFAKKLVMLNPLINCVVVSALSPEDFQEASEGLGLLAQLSLHPGKDDAENLIRKFKQIKNLL